MAPLPLAMDPSPTQRSSKPNGGLLRWTAQGRLWPIPAARRAPFPQKPSARWASSASELAAHGRCTVSSRFFGSAWQAARLLLASALQWEEAHRKACGADRDDG